MAQNGSVFPVVVCMPDGPQKNTVRSMCVFDVCVAVSEYMLAA